MTKLLAVFRRPEMLKALLCVPRVDTDNRDVAPYVERMVALGSVPETICPWRDADIRAWRSLGRVPNMSGRASKAIVRSLLSTITDPDYEPQTASSLSFGSGPIDMRPLLCNPDGEERVLVELGEAIPKEEDGSELPSWHWNRRQDIAALPKDFRRHFLWGLSLAPWEHLQLMVAVFETLELAGNPALSLAMARLALLGSRETTLWWSDVIAEVPDSGRASAVAAILEAGVARHMPDAASREALAAQDWTAASSRLTALAGGSR